MTVQHYAGPERRSASRPGDYVGYGALIMFLGALGAVLLAGYDAPMALVLTMASIFGVVGGTAVQVGVIAWGVHVGIRTANDE